MKDSKTLMAALLSGCTLIDRNDNIVFLKEGQILLVEKSSNPKNSNTGQLFKDWLDPLTWNVKESTSKFEEISTGGTVCWVWDEDSDKNRTEAVIAVKSSARKCYLPHIGD